jgi:signal recognition particle GTPase
LKEAIDLLENENKYLKEKKTKTNNTRKKSSNELILIEVNDLKMKLKMQIKENQNKTNEIQIQKQKLATIQKTLTATNIPKGEVKKLVTKLQTKMKNNNLDDDDFEKLFKEVMGDIDKIMSRDLEYGVYDNLLPQSKNKDSKTLKIENKLSKFTFLFPLVHYFKKLMKPI